MTGIYEPFASIPRLSRMCVITEKLDGTNALVHVAEDGSVRAGSRNKWLTPDDDNYGFARWVAEHAEELRALGHGKHFGEWWGQGIQRKYGMPAKVFSLFNTGRWLGSGFDIVPPPEVDKRTKPPECCSVVPVLGCGEFSTSAVDRVLAALSTFGSFAAPGFMKPEGVVVYHVAAGVYFKKTIEKDDMPKSRVMGAVR